MIGSLGGGLPHQLLVFLVEVFEAIYVKHHFKPQLAKTRSRDL